MSPRRREFLCRFPSPLDWSKQKKSGWLFQELLRFRQLDSRQRPPSVVSSAHELPLVPLSCKTDEMCEGFGMGLVELIDLHAVKPLVDRQHVTERRFR